MKYILIILIGFTLNSCKNKVSKIPPAVKTDFEKRFISADDVKWEIEQDGFEVEFEKEEVEMSANYDLKGIWTETEANINENDLPAIIKMSILNSYPEYRIEKAETVSTPSMKGFEIHLEKGNVEVELVMDENGVLLKIKDQEEEKGQ